MFSQDRRGESEPDDSDVQIENEGHSSITYPVSCRSISLPASKNMKTRILAQATRAIYVHALNRHPRELLTSVSDGCLSSATRQSTIRIDVA